MNHVIKRISFITFAVALVAATALASVTSVRAQDAAPGSGLRISPTRTELSLVASDTRDVVQTVKNVTQSAVTIDPQLNDFESNGVTGEPQLIGNQEEVSAYSLREFVTLPEKFDLAPDEEKEVIVKVAVPATASPGAYFGSVLYRALPQGSTGDGQVALVASVGSLILLEVPGNITEKIEIKDISAFIGDKSGSLFTKKPDNIGITIENLGNSFSQPFGKVSVKDMRGNEVFLYELNEGSPRGNILPASTRLFLDELFNVEVKTVNDAEQVEKTSPLKWPGRYTVTGNISHGTTGELFTVQSSFWYLPLWLLVVGGVLLVALIGTAFYLYKKYFGKATKRK